MRKPDAQKRTPLDGPRRRYVDLDGDPYPSGALPAISLPWVPMLIDHAMRRDKAASMLPVINEARFLDTVHRLGGWDLMGKGARWRYLLQGATRSPQGWLRDSLPDPAIESLTPLRKAAMNVLAENGITDTPYYPMGHHVRLRVFVRTISQVKDKVTGKKRSWISPTSLMPAVCTALRGILWADDKQIRDIQFRVEPTQSPHYRDIWSVRVEECFAREWPDWAMEDPGGSVYTGES